MWLKWLLNKHYISFHEGAKVNWCCAYIIITSPPSHFLSQNGAICVAFLKYSMAETLPTCDHICGRLKARVSIFWAGRKKFRSCCWSNISFFQAILNSMPKGYLSLFGFSSVFYQHTWRGRSRKKCRGWIKDSGKSLKKKTVTKKISTITPHLTFILTIFMQLCLTVLQFFIPRLWQNSQVSNWKLGVNISPTHMAIDEV